MSIARKRTRESAALLARLYYGLPAPAPSDMHEKMAVTRMLNGMRKNLEIDSNNQVTEHGAMCLRRYVERTKEVRQ